MCANNARRYNANAVTLHNNYNKSAAICVRLYVGQLQQCAGARRRNLVII